MHKTKDELQGKLNVTDGNQQSVPIQQLNLSKSWESLGVWMAMDGNLEKQNEVLLKNQSSLLLKYALCLVQKMHRSSLHEIK